MILKGFVEARRELVPVSRGLRAVHHWILRLAAVQVATPLNAVGRCRGDPYERLDRRCSTRSVVDEATEAEGTGVRETDE